MTDQQDSNKILTENTTKCQEPGRGALIIVLGILSIFLFILGPIFGIPAWVMGNKDLKKINKGLISDSEKNTTKAGMILGIISTLFFSTISFGIAIVVGINLFTSSSIQSNRDAILSEGEHISIIAQQYYRKPLAIGGGGNSFKGFTIPENLRITENGTYEVIIDSPEYIRIICKGKIIGTDGRNPIKVTFINSSENITFSTSRENNDYN